MARTKKADSTEALLDVIRQDGEQQLNFRDSAVPSSRSRAPQKKINKAPRRASKRTAHTTTLLGRVRNAVLGVDVGLDHMTVVKMSKAEPRRLLDIQTVAFESGAGIEDPGFGDKLRQLLGRVCGRNCEVWALYRAADVDISTVQVPSLSGSKLSQAVYWQLQKERKFSEEEFIFDYRVQREFKEGDVQKTEALTCLARRRDVERIQHHFTTAGYRLAGVTTIPSAFQNIYRTGWALSGGGLTASLHVGATFSCITIYDGADIRFSRSIKFGLDSMAEELSEAYNQGHVPGMLAAGKSQHMDVETGRRVLLAKLLDHPLDRSSPGYELTAKSVFESVQDSLERVARQAERTLDYYAQNFQRRCERLHLSGRLFGSKLIADYVSGELSLEMSVFDPLGEINISSLTSLGTLSERMGMNEAVAVALSDQVHTLNLVHNYMARERDRAKVVISNLVSVATLFLVFVMAGLFIWGKEMNKDLQMRTEELRAQLVQDVVVDEAALQRTMVDIGLRQTRLRAVSVRYEALAVLSELERLTPDSVRMLNLSMELTRADATETSVAGKALDASVRLIIVDAIILGNKTNFETDLTRYLIGLKSSQLFGDVVVQESIVQEFLPEGEVFHVVLHIQLA